MDLWSTVRANAPALVEELITDGHVDVDERNDMGETALHVASSRGFDAVVSVLLAHGADVTLQDWESGWTALHRSAHNAHLSMSLMLLRHARQHHGRQFMKTYLYDTKDFANQSAMQLVSSYTKLRVPVDNQKEMKENEDEEEEKGEEPEQEEDEEREWRPLAMERRGGMVYTFGKVDFQLGYHLPHVNVQSSPRLVELPITSPIVQISASKFHTIALNDRGQVYVWGFGKGGRLGTGTEFDHVEPTRLTLLDEIPIAQVAAGENHTLALSRSGQVFSWGSNSFGQLGHNVKASTHESRLTPKRIDAFKGMHMIGIAASGMHSGAICREEGFVYTWGSNKRGQLGRKEGFGVEQPNPTPKRVDRLVPGHALSVLYEPHDAMRVVQVAMSDVHTCVVLKCSKNGQSRGQVWQFGYGSNVPTRIVFKEKRRTNSHLLMNDAWLPRWKLHSNDIVSVSCAPNHSIALSACGSVYTWGHNGDALSHQQTKAKDFIPPGTPQRVMLDKYGPVVSICASQDHCAVVTKSGDLVSWGGGPQGVLGHGVGNSWQPSPKQVHGAKKVVSVAAGHQHTVLLVAPRLPDERRENTNVASSPPKLRNLLETKIAQFLDISNVATVWKYASTYSQLSLERYCLEYMQLNWDAMLEMGSKERLDTLFELMLAPAPKIVRSVAFAVDEDKSGKVKTSDRKSERKASISAEEMKSVPQKPELEVEPVQVEVSLPPPSPLLKPTPAVKNPAPPSARHVKGSKFVSVDAFFSEKVEDVRAKPIPPADGQTFPPWSTAKSPAVPVAAKQHPQLTTQKTMDQHQVKASGDVFPALGDAVSRPPRKQSMDHHSTQALKSPALGPSPSPKLTFAPVTSSPMQIPRKQVLGHDGSERPQMTAFSLDAFIKKSSRKKSRSDSVDLAKPTWGGAAMSASPPTATQPTLSTHKSLKQIQEEEEARAKAEAVAKAKNGGYVRKASSFNSWGLVQQQHHISLAELQQREEEERFLEEQRQIMAQIERENRQRLADEKRKAAKQEKATKAEPKESKTASGKAKKQKEKTKETNENTSKDGNQQTKPKEKKKQPDQPLQETQQQSKDQKKPQKPKPTKRDETSSAEVKPSIASDKKEKESRPRAKKKASKPATTPAPSVMAA